MREIKFRAWDKSANKFRGVKGVKDCFSLRSDGMVNNNYIIMQYTGLKDKNDKEIYEGDIVAALSRIGQVSYHEERAAFIFNDTFNELLFQGIGFDAEIIGNIHEHPELI